LKDCPYLVFSDVKWSKSIQIPYLRVFKLSRRMSQKYPTYKGLNLPEVSSRVMEQWEKDNIFQKSIDTREGKEPFIFFEGPPSANGLPWVYYPYILIM